MSDLTDGHAPGFWRMLWRTGGVLPIFLFVFAVVFTLISMNELRSGLAFASRGVEVMGQVMDRDEQRVRRDGKWQTDHYLTVRYDVAGKPMEMRRKVRPRVYEASDIGSLRVVRYLPEAPNRVEFEIGQTLRDGGTTRWVALGSGLAALLTLWWKGARAVDAIRARKFGRAEQVTVTGIRKIRHKNGYSYRLQWVDQDGVEGESLSSGSQAPFERYPVHSRVEVFRGVAGHMWWVGDIGPRKAAATVPSVAKH